MTAPRTTVTFVSMWDVIDAIFSKDDATEIKAHGFEDVSYGDASFTLVGNNRALSMILELCELCGIETEGVEKQYWFIVGQDNYINLES